MHIIKTNEIQNDFDNWEIRLDPHIKEFRKIHPNSTGKFMLILELTASEKATGIGRSNTSIEQFWILNREVGVRNNQLLTSKFFEFEILDEADSGKLLYIESNSFVQFLIYNEIIEDFGIENISYTISLNRNEQVRKLYAEFEQNRMKKFASLPPPEYYEKNFGIKSKEEQDLFDKAKKITDSSGSIEGSILTVGIFCQVIEINPSNAHAYFSRALAILDNLQRQKTSLFIGSHPGLSEKIKDLEEKDKPKAEKDFNKAISLNPYLEVVLDNFKKSGRVRL